MEATEATTVTGTTETEATGEIEIAETTTARSQSVAAGVAARVATRGRSRGRERGVTVTDRA